MYLEGNAYTQGTLVYWFKCRHCYDLTYRSVQTHDTRVDALRRNPARLAAILENPGGALDTGLILALKALRF